MSKIKETRVLLGVDKAGCIVFCDFGIDANGMFSACFDTSLPFKVEDGMIDDYFENFLEDLDDAEKYKLCEQYDCRPSDLAEYMAENCDDIRDAYDCSYYPETYEIYGDDWYFESMCGGQYDTREEGMQIYTDEGIYNHIHALWDKYHLVCVNDDIKKEVIELQEKCNDIIEGEDDWIINYIKGYRY